MINGLEHNLTKRAISKGVIKDIIVVAVGVIIIWVGLQIIFGTQNPFYVVSSGSMVPELEVYDVLVVNGNEPFEDVKTGDIIVFNRPAGHDRVIVHRVVAIIDDDPFTVRTKGDSNPASIPGTDFPVTKDEYIGKVAYVVPQIGYITRVLTPPINYIIIAVIIGIMIAKQISKSKKQKELTVFDSSKNKEKIDEVVTFAELDKLDKDDVYSNPSESTINLNEKKDPDEKQSEPSDKE